MATSERYERLKKLMARENLDVTVVISPENTLTTCPPANTTSAGHKPRAASVSF